MTSEAFRDAVADWRLPPWLTLSLLLTAVVYARGWFLIRKTRRVQFSSARLLSFLSGIAILWFAIASPMDEFADRLLSVHMVEHLLLMSVVPPLLWIGLPTVPILRGIPTPVRRRFIAPLLRQKYLRRLGEWITQPLTAWLLMNGMFLGWHVPLLYDLALENETVHGIEHLCFLASAMLFWRYILLPWPARADKHGWGILIYLVSADVVNTILAGVLSFCGRPVYGYYVEHGSGFQVDPLDDQVLGAVIMWVIGSIAFLIPAIIITTGLLQPARVLPHKTKVADC
ncbi:cytochrome c oxidase assembly protein [Terriglobus sp. TAA 43]|uniref:cytochrome c oxidase assembly protein n=1 Tax=Terriglobus sp. TAA 43 TaxID=278961 RepID=UPI00068AE983|nr:cytochrome c oxidase assembly protein [Terriglobus sp. TAA 43]